MSSIYETALDILNNQDTDKNKDNKFDCSSFVQFCYDQNKINIPRYSSEQWKKGEQGNGSADDIACWNGHIGI